MVSTNNAQGGNITVLAAANNAETLIVWSLNGHQIPNAQGVRITRINTADGSRTVLSSPTPFTGQTGSTQPSDVWPIQKPGHQRYFDFGVPEGTYKYEVTVMLGQPGKLTVGTTSGISNEVVSATQLTHFISACFNYGLISTQFVSRWINENCPPGALADAVAAQLQHDPNKTTAANAKLQPLVVALSTPGNVMREKLSSGMIEFAKGIIETAAATGGHVFDASYEVTDKEWLQFLTDNADLLSIILADITDGENAPALKTLQSTAAQVFSRRLANSYGIAHNKLQMLVNSEGEAVELITGADNKTMTGFCGQASNAVRVASSDLAAQGKAYWDQLKDDTVNQNSAQGPILRQWCNSLQPPVMVPNDDGTTTTIQAIFAPNNLSAQKPATGLTPGLHYLQDNIFAKLEPGDIVGSNQFGAGHIGVEDLLAQVKTDKPGVIMMVALNSFSAMPTQLPPSVPGEDPGFVVAQSLHAPFANLLPEILGLPNAHAFIHSKYVVIYKRATKQWIVITGSHNLGEKADADNDETMLVFYGCTPLGLAYFANNLAVYDHFLFRYQVNYNQAGTGYLSEDGPWQSLNPAQLNVQNAIMDALASGIASATGSPSATGSLSATAHFSSTYSGGGSKSGDSTGSVLPPFSTLLEKTFRWLGLTA